MGFRPHNSRHHYHLTALITNGHHAIHYEGQEQANSVHGLHKEWGETGRSLSCWHSSLLSFVGASCVRKSFSFFHGCWDRPHKWLVDRAIKSIHQLPPNPSNSSDEQLIYASFMDKLLFTILKSKLVNFWKLIPSLWQNGMNTSSFTSCQ